MKNLQLRRKLSAIPIGAASKAATSGRHERFDAMFGFCANMHVHVLDRICLRFRWECADSLENED